MTINWQGSLWKLEMLISLFISGVFTVFGNSALAQITPDGTLGTEGSVVTPLSPNVDRIDGGTIRGSNVFHSFQDFNIGEGRSAYFANPVGTENIFSRVTGGNASNINGTLGVLGNANLFLLNPNGILFGPNAQLDVRGSFVASTASSFSFGDGVEFSAANPQAAPLLKVNLTPGLQVGEKLQGEVENTGNLKVGGDLTLWSGTVASTGKLEAPTGKVTVEAVAGDAKVRDVTAQTATLSASRNLILEESHLRTNGDLSLLAQDTVRIRDSVTNPFVAQAGGNLLVQGNKGVDILALNHPQTPFVSGGNLDLISDGFISLDSNYISGGDFSVRTLSGQPGDFSSIHSLVITTNGNYSVGDYIGPSLEVTFGGNIDYGNVVINSKKADEKYPTFELKAGGSITGNGNVSTTVQGGLLRVYLEAYGDIKIKGDITASSNTSNDYSTITINSIQGSVFLDGAKITASNDNNEVSALAGDIIINAARNIKISNGSQIEARGRVGRISIGKIDFSENGLLSENILITGGSSVKATNDKIGNAGLIAIRALDTVNINNSSINTDASGYANGGNLELDAKNLNLVKGYFGTNIYNPISESIAGNISIKVKNSAYFSDISQLESSVKNSNEISVGKGGTIKIDADSISLTEGSGILSNVFEKGKGFGGNIVLTARDIIYLDGVKNTGSGRGAYTSIQSDLGFVGNYDKPTPSGIGGDVSINSRSVKISNGAFIASRTNGIGDAGKVNINSIDSVDIRGVGSLPSISEDAAYVSSAVYSDVDKLAEGNGGNIIIKVESGSLEISRGAVLSASTSGNGNSGNIVIDTRDFVLFEGRDLDKRNNNLSGVYASTGSEAGISSKAGDIKITTASLDIVNGAQVSAKSVGSRNSGNITLNARNISLTNQSSVIANNEKAYSTENFGNIIIQGINNIQPLKTLIVDDSVISSSTQQGRAGSVIVNARDSVQLIGRFQGIPGTSSNYEYETVTLPKVGGLLVQATDPNGSAGKLIVSTKKLVVENEAQVLAKNISGLSGGDIELRDIENLLIINKGSINASTNNGIAGSLTVNNNITPASSITLMNQGTISLKAEGEGKGDAGDILLNTENLTLEKNSIISAEASGSGKAGSLTINANQFPTNSIKLTESSSIKLSSNSGQAGEININTRQLNLDSSNISAATISGTGTGITLEGLNILDSKNSLISASTRTGIAGDLTVKAPNGIVKLDGISLISDDGILRGGLSVAANQEGENSLAGNLIVNTRTLEVKNGAQITASNQSSKPSDDKLLSNVKLDGLNTLKVINGLISASTITGKAGSVTINAGEGATPAESVELWGNINDGSGKSRPAGISVTASGEGIAGDVIVNTRNLKVENGAQISASNESAQPANNQQLSNITLQGLNTLQVTNGLISASTDTGKAGNVTVNASTGTVQLNGTLPNDSQRGGISVVATGNNGKAGSLTVKTRTLTVSDGAKIAASATTGTAGDVTINATDFIQLSDRGSGLFAQSTGGIAGDLTATTRNLTVSNGAQIAASTTTGRARNVTVNATDFIQLRDRNSGLFAQSTGGKAGNLEITTGQFTIDKGAQAAVTSTGMGQAGNLLVRARSVALNEGASISATNEETPIGSPGGNIKLEGLNLQQPLESLQVTNSEISASTKGGQAGNLNITTADSVRLNGRSTLAVRATEQGGKAGNLKIHTNVLTLDGEQAVADEDKARVSVSSPKGQAGDLEITARKLTLSRGMLEALTGASDSSQKSTGNINLRGLEVLFLKNESGISATANGEATGGNVSIKSDWIFGFYPTGANGSDINANAVRGNGGRVDITRKGIFGLEYRFKPTPLNDITASSEFGQAGTVAFQGLEVDPTRGLSPLPNEPVDPSGLIDTSCSATNNTTTSSQFVSTGRGGLPPSPNDPLNPDATITRLATLSPSSNTQTSATNLSPPEEKTPQETVVEAQGWVRLLNGRIKLVTQTATVTRHGNWQSSTGCYAR